MRQLKSFLKKKKPMRWCWDKTCLLLSARRDYQVSWCMCEEPTPPTPPAPTAISIAPDSVILFPTDTKTLTATVEPEWAEEYYPVSRTSTEPFIATVEDWVVTYVAQWEATITATSGEVSDTATVICIPMDKTDLEGLNSAYSLLEQLNWADMWTTYSNAMTLWTPEWLHFQVWWNTIFVWDSEWTYGGQVASVDYAKEIDEHWSVEWNSALPFVPHDTWYRYTALTDTFDSDVDWTLMLLNSDPVLFNDFLVWTNHILHTPERELPLYTEDWESPKQFEDAESGYVYLWYNPDTHQWEKVNV